MKIYWTKITRIIEESSEVKTFFLEKPEDFVWEEGARTHMALKGFDAGEDGPNRSLIRHMSIMTMPHENIIGITTRIKEQCSEFKETLKNIEVGEEIALFKTYSHVPLQRDNKSIYLLSQGVGIATFRPLVLEYLENNDAIKHVYSFNIDSSRDYLYTDVFETNETKRFTARFYDNRTDYYENVTDITADKDGLYYVVGSDPFIKQNVDVLLSENIPAAQIILDKHEHEYEQFIPKTETLKDA